MVNITHKTHTLRKAIAQAIVRLSRHETLTAIKENRVPKGDIFQMAKAAGLFAAKRTSDMIPDCHPLPVEFTEVRYRMEDLSIFIEVEVHTVYKTGVEVEAMHAASVVALTMYDMLKPIDWAISIEQIKLLEKKGGKSSFNKETTESLSASIIICSDSISQGLNEDQSGLVIKEILEKNGLSNIQRMIVSDDVEAIQAAFKNSLSEVPQLIILSGGTGVSPRDNTPEAIGPLLEKRLPGVEELMRAYGQLHTPYAMLSRSVAGICRNALVLALPGSAKGVRECLSATMPHILHAFSMMKGEGH